VHKNVILMGEKMDAYRTLMGETGGKETNRKT
jgi:hypothetical protein